MINFIIPLLGSYFQSGIASYYLFFIVALAFVSFVPYLVSSLFVWRD